MRSLLSWCCLGLSRRRREITCVPWPLTARSYLRWSVGFGVCASKPLNLYPQPSDRCLILSHLGVDSVSLGVARTNNALIGSPLGPVDLSFRALSGRLSLRSEVLSSIQILSLGSSTPGAWPTATFRTSRTCLSSSPQARPPLSMRCHPGGNRGANLEPITHRCYLSKVAFEWELTIKTIYLPLGCLQGGMRWNPQKPTAIPEHRGRA